MTRLLRRTVALILGTLASVVFGHQAAAQVLDTTTIFTYTYDTPHYGGPADHTSPERGPPVTSYNDTTTAAAVVAVAAASHGASLRPEAITTHAYTTYDTTASHTQIDDGGTTTSDHARVISVDLSALELGFVAAKTGSTVAQTAIHGSSASSPARAYLYRFYDSETGNYLKTGISKSPGTRYAKGFMEDKEMQILQSGSRREMLNLERFIVERNRGLLNREPWAGVFGWDVP